jgi:hypothetical protein
VQRLSWLQHAVQCPMLPSLPAWHLACRHMRQMGHGMSWLTHSRRGSLLQSGDARAKLAWEVASQCRMSGGHIVLPLRRVPAARMSSFRLVARHAAEHSLALHGPHKPQPAIHPAAQRQHPKHVSCSYNNCECALHAATAATSRRRRCGTRRRRCSRAGYR